MTTRYETLRCRALTTPGALRDGRGRDLLLPQGLPAWLGTATTSPAPQALPVVVRPGAAVPAPAGTPALALLLSAMVLAYQKEERS